MCEHLKFKALTQVGRITETEGGPVYRYTADITIKCADCGLPFEFIGVPAGESPDGPRTSIDFTELRIPIRPETGLLAANADYQVKPTKQKDSPVN